MKTESVASKEHFLMGKCKEIGLKRFLKFVVIYGLYLAIVLSFDYLYIPWLAIKFRYLTFFPLYVSLFFVCLLGLGLYEFFKEDIFFKEKITVWLSEKGKYVFTRWLKKIINGNPRFKFSAIAIWWSPLHAYIFFRKDSKNRFGEVIKMLGLGAFHCAFFWSVIVYILVALWDLGELFMKHYL